MKVLIADLFSEEKIKILKDLKFEIMYNDKLNGDSLVDAMKQFQPEVLVVRFNLFFFK